MLAVFKKELRYYFTSAVGYVFMGVFLLMTGIFFASDLLGGGSSPSADYTNVLLSSTFLLLFLIPVITMKTLSEEARQKTDQLLFTAPVSITRIVLGKYFAALALFLIALLVTCINPLILSLFGKVAFAQTFGQILGFALLGATFIAIGIFISSLTENQIVALVATIGVLLLTYLISAITQIIPTTLQSGIVLAGVLAAILILIIYFSTHNIFVTGITAIVSIAAIVTIYIIKKTLYEGFTSKFLGWFSLLDRFQAMVSGVLDFSSILYYISFSFVFVFLSIRLIEKRRWS
ncbi:MAG: ABC transporter permease [Bacillota bacterium]|nr:ABC transporter permease [Bacillota bacterium]